MKDLETNVGTLDASLPIIRVNATAKHQYEMLLNMSRDAIDREENELGLFWHAQQVRFALRAHLAYSSALKK